jgi:hypothetical protein
MFDDILYPAAYFLGLLVLAALLLYGLPLLLALASW